MQSNPIPPFSQMEYDYCNINWVFVKILVGLVVNQTPPPPYTLSGTMLRACKP